MSTKHPAKFSDVLLPVIYNIVKNRKLILDPFAGTGKLADIVELGFDGAIFLNELEPEWYITCRERENKPYSRANAHLGDACHLPYIDSAFDAIVTSPTFGNRMADSHIPGEGWDAARSQRNTYTHALGHKLTYHNSGAMQWGDAYRELHVLAWQEAQRVLKPNGLFVLNIKDHIRGGKRMKVAQWHVDTLLSLGFSLTNKLKVLTPGQRYGQNAKVRIDYEYVLTFVNNPDLLTFTDLEDYSNY